jgi:hypothetical protein
MRQGPSYFLRGPSRVLDGSISVEYQVLNMKEYKKEKKR